MKLIKIVICGGHFTPALALIEKLQQKKTYQIFYIGRKMPLEGEKTLSLEYLTLNKIHIPFYSLSCSRLQRTFTIFTLPSLLKFPLSLIQSFVILVRVRPKVVFSFGGYIALPICISAWILKIPVVTHEQTHVMGLANRIISRFAEITCLSWFETLCVPKSARTEITGSPIRSSIFGPYKRKTVDFDDKNLPLLYITGGSVGSRSINKIVAKSISSLVFKYRIIHQCGSADKEADFQILLNRKNSLPNKLKKNYQVIKHISTKNIGTILHQATLIVGRSGANTVFEIAAVGKPAIFIPLPWSAQNEQEYNAKTLEEKGAAIIIKQKNFTPETFIEAINKIMDKYFQYEKAAQKIRSLVIVDAAERIVKILESLFNNN